MCSPLSVSGASFLSFQAAALGIESFPALVSIKGKRDKRLRAAAKPLAEESDMKLSATNWVDNILGGARESRCL